MDAIKLFAKRNRALFLMFIVACVVILSYYITYDMPELIPGIEKWYNLLTNLCIGIVINFFFYIFQVYIPARDAERKSFVVIKSNLEKLRKDLKEFLLVVDTYVLGIESNQLIVNSDVVYYKSAMQEDAEYGWARKFEFNRDLPNSIRAIKSLAEQLLTSAYIHNCDENLMDILYDIQSNQFYWKLEQATSSSFNAGCSYQNASTDLQKLKEANVKLQKWLGTSSPYCIITLTADEIAFFEARLSTVPEENIKDPSFIANVSMKMQ